MLRKNSSDRYDLLSSQVKMHEEGSKFQKIGRIPLIWADDGQSEEGKSNCKGGSLALIPPAFSRGGHRAGTTFNNIHSTNDKTCHLSPSPLHFGPYQFR